MCSDTNYNLSEMELYESCGSPCDEDKHQVDDPESFVLQSRIYVRIPYELKDLFRSEFPSAKWCPCLIRWSVPSYSGERLELFLSTLNKSGALDDVRAFRERVLSDEEIVTLQSQLDGIKGEIRALLEDKWASFRRAYVRRLESEIKKRQEWLRVIKRGS